VEYLQRHLQQIESLLSEKESTLEHGVLTSTFEIESRPGRRSTKVSQKLRQESDSAKLTPQDKRYTELISDVNFLLYEILEFPPWLARLTQGNNSAEYVTITRSILF
jgi:hypothetical protein